MTGPVVILGTGRCGSSIVGRLFERVMPYRFEPRMSTLRPAPDRRECWKLPWDDDGRDPGCRVRLDELDDLDAHVIWLVRHPLDHACSARPLWEDRPDEEADANGGAWLAENADPLLAAVVGWLNVNHRGLDAAMRTLRSLHVVRYEDVVSDPVWAGRLMLSSAGLDVDEDAVDEWAGTVGNVKSRDDEDPRQADLWYRDDHTVRVGRWRQNLPDAAVDPLWTAARPVAERFGYSVDGDV